MNSESKQQRALRRARHARSGERDHKHSGSDFPKFLVRLVGWRRARKARTEPRPSYRHD